MGPPLSTMAPRQRSRLWTRPLFALLLVSLSLVPLERASADLGPKPTLELIFDFSQLAVSVEFDEVRLYGCGDDPACAQREPLANLPGQSMTCDAERCTAALMQGGRFWQVEAVASGRVRTSQPFEKIGFYTVYRLVVLEDSLRAEFEYSRERASPVTAIVLTIALALLATEVIELLVAFAYLWITREPKVTLVAVALVNLITLPTVWILMLLLNSLGQWAVMGIETMAVIVFEAVFMLGLRRGKMRASRAFTLSALMNAASFVVGLVALGAL